MEDFRKWESYADHLAFATKAFYANSGSLLSFFHYDPRAHLEDWRAPFNNHLVQTAPETSFPEHLPTIGIKMYTALGYRPFDRNLDFPWDAC
jgi:hypothetical protein